MGNSSALTGVRGRGDCTCRWLSHGWWCLLMTSKWPLVPVPVLYGVYFALGRFSETSLEKRKGAEALTDSCSQTRAKRRRVLKLPSPRRSHRTSIAPARSPGFTSTGGALRAPRGVGPTTSACPKRVLKSAESVQRKAGVQRREGSPGQKRPAPAKPASWRGQLSASQSLQRALAGTAEHGEGTRAPGSSGR